MNKKLAFAIPLSLFLIACAGQQNMVPNNCAVVKIPSQCVNQNFVNINTQSRKANPVHICPDAGDDIEIRVTPANGDTGSVSTSPKPTNPNQTWLNGTNDPDASGFVLDPPDNAGGYSFDYKITFADGSCIDPRISL